MSQVDVDIQLKVWKDLAVSKQVLMGVATEALGLDAECSADELRAALAKALQRAKDADINMTSTREKAAKDTARMEALVASSQQAQAAAEEKAAKFDEASQAAARQLAAGRSENAEALKKARAEITDKQNKLKAISKSLADTPENVVKKLKVLKKQKMDEAKLRTQSEAKLRTLGKEKTRLEAELESQKNMLQQAQSLAATVRELHGLCKQANKKIKSLSEDKKDLLKIPKLDQDLLDQLEKTDNETN